MFVRPEFILFYTLCVRKFAEIDGPNKLSYLGQKIL